ncbi:MAG: tol-pal system protein YbgF [Thermodesulfobacteriota bacterium]
MPKKEKLILLLISLFFIFQGCASQSDLENLQRDTNNNTKEILALQRNLYDFNTELKNISNKLDSLSRRTEELRREVTALSTETKAKFAAMEKEVEVASQPMRRYQADLGARIDKLQMDLQNLTGRFEETKYFAQKTFGETKEIRDTYQRRLEELEKRVESLNKSLENWEKKAAVPEQESKEVKQEEKTLREQPKVEEKVPPPKEAKVETLPEKPPATPEEAYKRAYDQFTKGDIRNAKEGFKKFLEAYPKSKLAENAHYWLGECYFAEKKYEEAILEFDEVIKKYPKGNKVPDALYRQGLAFLEMKDTINAKLILREVIKRFPKSDQANRARKKLQEIG